MSTILTNKIETKSGGLTLDPGAGGSVTVLGSLSGTILTAAQTNITSVGTLSSLAVSGDVSIADKIIHTGDTNTAIRFPAADTLTIETGGSERVRVDSSGNVGIGTSSPAQPLHVKNGGSSACRLLIENTGSSSVDSTQIWSQNNDLVLNASGGERVRINSDGIKMPNGLGIDFSASAGGGATSSLLDDYEEGTFTPTAEGATTAGTTTYTVRSGSYTKIGNVVTVNLRVTYSSLTGTGNLLIGGLPFTVAAASIGSILASGLNWTAGTYLIAETVSSTNNLTILSNSDNLNASIQQCVNETVTLRISLTYFV